MKARERVLTAIEHKEPDRVPLDVWFRTSLWKSIKNHFGVTDEGAVRKKLGVDFYEVVMNGPAEFEKRGVLLDMMPWSSVIPLPGGLYKDEWGVTYEIGATGDFYHIVDHPLQHMESLDDYAFPDISADGRFEEAERLTKERGDEFAIEALMTMGLFDTSWYLRGYERFIHDLYSNSTLVDRLLDKLLEFRIAQGERFVEMGADIIKLGDDIGMQTGMMINPSIWRRYFKPRLKTLIEALKSKGSVYVFYHSDGDIRQVIPDLIEIGVDILNPVQPECMDPAEIKQTYGEKLTLHGTISLQVTLPSGSREDIIEEVRTRIETCGHNGGLIIAPSNRTTPDVPLRNILAMYEAGRKLGKYPIGNPSNTLGSMIESNTK